MIPRVHVTGPGAGAEARSSVRSWVQTPDPSTLPVVDLGRMAYRAAFERQERELESLVAARPSGRLGVVLFVEHDPVVTVSRRGENTGNLLSTPAHLAALGIDVAPTDRGGDITYHGPGQIVVYPILDLEVLRLKVGDYLRLLEQAVMDTCAAFGLPTVRDPEATGVWTLGPAGGPHAKVCAIGVRVRRWATMHGLALNVSTNLDHFAHIVPCGLVGRPVTSLARELGPVCPGMDRVKSTLADNLSALLLASQGVTRR